MRDKKGITLVEILVSSVLLVLVLGTLFYFYISSRKNEDRINKTNEASLVEKQFLNQLSQDIRSSNFVSLDEDYLVLMKNIQIEGKDRFKKEKIVYMEISNGAVRQSGEIQKYYRFVDEKIEGTEFNLKLEKINKLLDVRINYIPYTGQPETRINKKLNLTLLKKKNQNWNSF